MAYEWSVNCLLDAGIGELAHLRGKPVRPSEEVEHMKQHSQTEQPIVSILKCL